MRKPRPSHTAVRSVDQKKFQWESTRQAPQYTLNWGRPRACPQIDPFQNLRKGLSSLAQKNARVRTWTILDRILGKSQCLWLIAPASSYFFLHLHSSHLTFLPYLSTSLPLFTYRNYWNPTGPFPAQVSSTAPPTPINGYYKPCLNSQNYSLGTLTMVYLVFISPTILYAPER